MINLVPSTSFNTTVSWKNDSCTAVVDIGTVDATSAVQLKLLLEKLDTHVDIRLAFDEYGCAIVQWQGYVQHLGDAQAWHDRIINVALYRLAPLRDDIDDYNHICAIRDAADEFAEKRAA
jgi:hypothetical protein